METPAARGGGSGCASGSASDMWATVPVGVATSITLSASSASLLRSIEVSVDARTIRTFEGRRCKKSSRRKEEEGTARPQFQLYPQAAAAYGGGVA